MADRSFSIGAAVGSAMALTTKRPLTVLVWGVAYALPYLLMLALYVPFMGKMMQLGVQAEQTGADPDAAINAMMGDMLMVQGFSGLLSIVQLVVGVVVVTAVMRAVFQREGADRFFFMRLGMDELRLAVAYIAVTIGAYIVLLVLVMIGVGVGFALFQAPEPVNYLLIGLLGLVVMIVWLALYLRVSLIPAACVYHRDFAFAEGLRAGKGQVMRLLGLTLLIIVIALIASFVVYAVLALTAVAVVAGGSAGVDWSDPNALSTFRPNWTLIAAAVAILFLPLSFFIGWVTALSIAPYADAYRQLVPVERADEIFQ